MEIKVNKVYALLAIVFIGAIILSHRVFFLDRFTVYKGFIMSGFEWNEFASCEVIQLESGEDTFQVGFSVENNVDWERYIAPLNHDSEPIYVEVKGRFDPNGSGGYGCCGILVGAIKIHSFQQVLPFTERKCDPVKWNYEQQISVEDWQT